MKDFDQKRLKQIITAFKKCGYTKKQAYDCIKTVIFLFKATDIAEV